MRPVPTRVPSEESETHRLRLVESSPENRAHLASLAWLAAVGAAGCGTALWASIAWLTDLEVGYVAWGIGAGIGLAAARSGGRGLALATFAALLSLGAIFAGKIIAARITPHSQAFEMSSYYTEERYRSAMAFERQPPSFGEWRLRAIESDREALADFSAVEAVVDGLGPVDWMFALLAIATAFGLVARND